jgi:hypothetical protein
MIGSIKKINNIVDIRCIRSSYLSVEGGTDGNKLNFFQNPQSWSEMFATKNKYRTDEVTISQERITDR